MTAPGNLGRGAVERITRTPQQWITTNTADWIANDRQLRRLIAELRQAADEPIELMLQADESHWGAPDPKTTRGQTAS